MKHNENTAQTVLLNNRPILFGVNPPEWKKQRKNLREFNHQDIILRFWSNKEGNTSIEVSLEARMNSVIKNITSFMERNGYKAMSSNNQDPKPIIYPTGWMNSGKDNDHTFYFVENETVYFISGVMGLNEIKKIISGYYVVNTGFGEEIETIYDLDIVDGKYESAKFDFYSDQNYTWIMLMQAYGKYHGISNTGVRSIEYTPLKDEVISIEKPKNGLSELY